MEWLTVVVRLLLAVGGVHTTLGGLLQEVATGKHGWESHSVGLIRLLACMADGRISLGCWAGAFVEMEIVVLVVPCCICCMGCAEVVAANGTWWLGSAWAALELAASCCMVAQLLRIVELVVESPMGCCMCFVSCNFPFLGHQMILDA